MGDDDPTCLIRMLNEFRAKVPTVTQSCMMNERNTAVPTMDASNSNSSQARRQLTFDETMCTSTDNITLSTKRKRDLLETDDDIPESPWEIRRIKTDLQECRERITKFTDMKQQLERFHHEEVQDLKTQIQILENKCRDMDVHLSQVRWREDEARKELEKVVAAANEERCSLNQKLLKLQVENASLVAKGKEIQRDVSKEKDEIESGKKCLESELNMLRYRVIADKKEKENLIKDLEEKTNSLVELEKERLKLVTVSKRLKDLEWEHETYVENKIYVESQVTKLKRFGDLERDCFTLKEENQRLKSSIGSMLRLENEVENLKTRQAAADNLQKEVVNLRAENEFMMSQLQKWNQLVLHYCKINDADDKPSIIRLQRYMDDLLRKELLHAAEKSDLQLSVKHMSEKSDKLQREIDFLNEEVRRLTGSCDTYTNNIRKLKKQLHLTTWERNDLRNLLDACQKDVTFISSDGASQVDVVQKAVDGYKQRAEILESDPLFSLTVGSDHDGSPVCNSETLRKCRELEKENEHLKSRIEEMEAQLNYCTMKGAIDPRNTKILHMKLNPALEAAKNYEDRLIQANKEAERLRERVKLLEEGHTQDITQIVEEQIKTNSSKEVIELRDRVKSQEIQNQRLREAFKKCSQDFRDAIYLLLGYKVDSLPGGKYRLCSMYAEDPDDVLLFQISQSSSGTMEMLETSFSNGLRELIDEYLTHHNSIPLFLSALTMDLFKKQTVVSNSVCSIQRTLVSESSFDHN